MYYKLLRVKTLTANTIVLKSDKDGKIQNYFDFARLICFLLIFDFIKHITYINIIY